MARTAIPFDKNEANKALELMATFAPWFTFRLPASQTCNS